MSTNFSLTTSSPAVNVIQSINYLLATQPNIAAIANAGNLNLGNVVQVSSNNAIFSNVGIIGYVNAYMDVKYANSATGSSGFTSNSTLANYYGVYNSPTNSESSNPVDYQWTQVSGGFGTTKGLYYTTGGGGTISFFVGTTAPNQYYQPVPDNVPIVLATISKNLVTSNSIQPQAVTNVQIATATITNVQIAANTITANNIQANTITAAQIAAGTITADKIAANALVANTVVSTGSTLEVPTGTGFWFDGNTGNAYMGGNTTIGTNLTVGNNAVIGGFATIGANVSIGGNLNIGGLVTGGNLNNNTVITSTIVNQSVSQGVGQSSGTNYTINTPRTDNSTSSSIYYTYPYAVANVANVVSADSIYVNASWNGYITTANTATITTYASLLRYNPLSNSNVVLVKNTLPFNATGGNLTNQNFYINSSFTYFDFGLTVPPNYYTYYVAFSVQGNGANASVANATSLVTSMTFYTGTVVAQKMKK